MSSRISPPVFEPSLCLVLAIIFEKRERKDGVWKGCPCASSICKDPEVKKEDVYCQVAEQAPGLKCGN